MHLFPGGHCHRLQALGQLLPVQTPEDPPVGVGIQLPQILGEVELSVELTRLPRPAPLHVRHGGLHNAPRLQRHQLGRVHIIDPVTQGGEHAALRIVEGHGPDPRHRVPKPYAQLVCPRFGAGGLGRQLEGRALPPDLKRHGCVPLLRHQLLDLLNRVHLSLVDVGDHISRLQAAGPSWRGRALRRVNGGQSHHQHTGRHMRRVVAALVVYHRLLDPLREVHAVQRKGRRDHLPAGACHRGCRHRVRSGRRGPDGPSRQKAGQQQTQGRRPCRRPSGPPPLFFLLFQSHPSPGWPGGLPRPSCFRRPAPAAFSQYGPPLPEANQGKSPAVSM